MISTILKIIIAIYFVMTILEIRNIHIYNLDSNLITIEKNINREYIQYEMQNLSPIILKNIYNDNIDNETLVKKNPGYMIQEEGKFTSLRELKEDYYIYENSKIVDDLKINTNEIYNNFKNKFTINNNSSLSLFGDNIQSVILKCVHNITCFTCSSSFIFYLFNPKHVNDILGKDLQEIKKWAIKIELKKGDILYIPCEWNYIYEGKGNLLRTTFDNIFSVGYNFLRE